MYKSDLLLFLKAAFFLYSTICAATSFSRRLKIFVSKRKALQMSFFSKTSWFRLLLAVLCALQSLQSCGAELQVKIPEIQYAFCSAFSKVEKKRKNCKRKHNILYTVGDSPELP